jgi:hydroxymethylbilane synthase
MNERKTIIIGTRGSQLAMKQSQAVCDKLKAFDPELQIEIKIIKTEGDVNQSPIPSDVMGKGWFTKEIEKELLNGTIDLAVHSLKDLPEKLPEGLDIGAYPEREDPRDAFVSKEGLSLAQLPKGAIIGTDSPRRRVQILAIRPDVEVKSIRGNVPTRLEKMESQGYDAVVLAAAGLKRLGLENRITHYFDPDEMTSAPGQGILAVEFKIGNSLAESLAAAITDTDAERAARIERTFSREVGGGCKQPVGAYVECEGNNFTLRAVVAHEDGSHIVRDSISGLIDESVELSIDLAKKMTEALKKENRGNGKE